MVSEIPSKNQNDYTPTSDEYHAISRFIFNEAQLADKGKYDAWLALWGAEDIQYWVPCNVDDADPAESLAIILDNRAHLEERMVRMKHRRSHTFSQPARAQRVIGNICISKENDEWVVTSNFVLGSVIHDSQDVWFGETEHRLTEEQGVLRIHTKKVNLLNNNQTLKSLLFLP